MDQVVRVQGLSAGNSVLAVPAGHRGDVPDQHRPAPWIGDVRIEFGEVAEHSRVEVDQTLGGGKSGGCGGEALAQRIEQVNPFRGIGMPPALGDHLTVAQHHQAVQFDVRCRVHRVQEPDQTVGVDPDG